MSRYHLTYPLLAEIPVSWDSLPEFCSNCLKLLLSALYWRVLRTLIIFERPHLAIADCHSLFWLWIAVQEAAAQRQVLKEGHNSHCWKTQIAQLRLLKEQCSLTSFDHSLPRNQAQSLQSNESSNYSLLRARFTISRHCSSPLTSESIWPISNQLLFAQSIWKYLWISRWFTVVRAM